MLTQKREVTVGDLGTFPHEVNVDGIMETLLENAKSTDAEQGAILEYHYFKSVAIQAQAKANSTHNSKTGGPLTVESAQALLGEHRGIIGRVADPIKKKERIAKDVKSMTDAELAEMGLSRVPNKARKSA